MYGPSLHETPPCSECASGDMPGAIQAIRAAQSSTASETGIGFTWRTASGIGVIVLAEHPDGIRAAATLSGAVIGPVLSDRYMPLLQGVRPGTSEPLDHVAAILGQAAYA